MLCGDIRTEMVEHKICLLTSALNQIGHVDNTGEDRSVFKVIAKWICIVLCLSIMYLFSVTSANITVSHVLLKLDFFNYIFVADSTGLSTTTLI